MAELSETALANMRAKRTKLMLTGDAYAVVQEELDIIDDE